MPRTSGGTAASTAVAALVAAKASTDALWLAGVLSAEQLGDSFGSAMRTVPTLADGARKAAAIETLAHPFPGSSPPAFRRLIPYGLPARGCISGEHVASRGKPGSPPCAVESALRRAD